jgi:hypothetical protein
MSASWVLVLASGAACQGPLGSADRVTAVGWTPAGQVLVATETHERPAKLWAARPHGKLRPIPFDFCDPINVLSVFPVSSGRVGLTVWCSQPDEVRLVSMDPSSGRVEPFVGSPVINDGVWSEATGTGFVDYGTGKCYGVGEVSVDGVQPVALTVVTPTGTVSLASDLPPPGGSGCTAHALARRPTIAENGRYLAFFLHTCDDWCTGEREFDEDWRVVVQDRSTGRIDVSSPRFRTPHDLAVSNDGALAISARYNDTTGVWYCTAGLCEQPRRLAEGTFYSPNFRPDGARMVVVEGVKEITYLDVR